MSFAMEPTTRHMVSQTIRPGAEEYRRAIEGLEALQNNPDQLELERERKFTRPPPVYRSPSGTTTEYDFTEPVQLTEEEEERERLANPLVLELRQSRPSEQFSLQGMELASELYTLKERRLYTCLRKFQFSHITHALFLVKLRWIQQGIWKDEWDTRPTDDSTWKHEDPLPPPPESDSESDDPPPMAKPRDAAAFRSTLFGSTHEGEETMPPKKPPPRIKRYRDGPAESLERAASRPIYQFMAQLTYQRERILKELDEPPPNQGWRIWRYYDEDLHQRCQAARDQWFSDRPAEDDPARIPFDINTMAYARLRALWTQWKIWDTRWGVLPGMSWKHEYPFKEELEVRVRAALEKRPPQDNPGPFRPGWLEEAGRKLWGEELIVARYGPLFSRAYEVETYKAKMAERGIAVNVALDEFGEPLESTGKEGSLGAASPEQHATLGKPSGASAPSPAPEAQEAGVSPATAEPVAENSRASSPSPPARQKQRRGRATKSVPSGDVGSTALKPVRPGRVPKPRKPTQAGGSRQVGGSGAPTVHGPVTPRRRSQRLQLASEERRAVEIREDPGRSGPVRRGTRSMVGVGATSGKKPVGIAKRGPPQTRGKRG